MTHIRLPATSTYDSDKKFLFLKYSKFANKKTAVKFNLKKGWKLMLSHYAQKSWARSESFKNGGKVKVAGGSGFVVCAEVQNTKTRQRHWLYLLNKSVMTGKE